MARLRIISLSHRATWLDVKCDEALEKMSSLNEGSLCWLKLNRDKSKSRRGIYKVTKLKRQNFIAAHLVTEHQITEEYKSLKILQEEGCLPEGVNVPIGVPKASKTILIFDLAKGLCYAFYPGVTSPFENIQVCLSLLEKDTGIPMTAARSFYYDKGIVEIITAVADSLGYKPYLSKADLDTVKITAEGDLDLNDDWKTFEESIKDNNKKWLTVGYRRSTDNYNELFKLYNRNRSSDISLLHTEELSYDDIVERIINVKSILETALGKEVCDCCFPESITTTLSQFNE